MPFARPSSVTSIVSTPALAPTRTSALDASAWRSTLVSDSWTIRKAARPIADGTGSALDLEFGVGAQAGGARVVDQSRQRLEVQRRRGRRSVVALAQQAQCRA